MSVKIIPAFYSGTSGLVLSIPKKLFPAEYRDYSRLSYYASLFNSIEINSTFYKLPMAATIHKWSGMVPQHFTFTFKIWKEITHQKELSFNPEDVSRSINIINHIGDKKGCLLVQLPPSLSKANLSRLEMLLHQIRKADSEQEWKIFVEFRNRSWYQQEVYDMLLRQNAGMVIHDLPSSVTPAINFPASFVYLRFHGPDGSYRGSYSDGFLSERSSHIRDWLKEGKTVYAYFNNTMGEVINNLMKLNEFIRN